jgi:hypothetical protein
MSGAAPIQHPDVLPLRERCRELRMLLRGLVTENHRMSTEERPRLSALYDHHFGLIERERQRAALDAADIQRRVELLTIKHTRGEQITPRTVEIINEIVDREFARMRERVADEPQTHGVESGFTELTSMFRTLAKQLHPDAVGDDPELQRMWHTAHAAYQERDAARLRALLATLHVDEREDATAVDDLPALIAEAERLETRIRLERRLHERMLTSEPFSIAASLEDPTWCDAHRKELEAAIAAYQREVVLGKERYEMLAGSPFVAAETIEKPAEEKKFDEDFFGSTYFGKR